MNEARTNMIYAVTEGGQNPNDAGRDILLRIYAERHPGAAGGVSIMSGPDLNDPAALAAMLEAGDENDLVVVVLPDELVPCKTGPGDDGLEVVIGILRENIEKGYGQTSWEALSQSILENRKEG